MPIEAWHRHYNAVRPHSALGRRPPAQETIVMLASCWRHAGVMRAWPLRVVGKPEMEAAMN